MVLEEGTHEKNGKNKQCFPFFQFSQEQLPKVLVSQTIMMEGNLKKVIHKAHPFTIDLQKVFSRTFCPTIMIQFIKFNTIIFAARQCKKQQRTLRAAQLPQHTSPHIQELVGVRHRKKGMLPASWWLQCCQFSQQRAEQEEVGLTLERFKS